MAKQHIFQHHVEGLKDFDKYLDKLGSGGSHYEAVGALEKVLRAAYLETQALTHILTGSLKASGRTQSNYTKRGGGEWTGEIIYGGQLHRPPAPGPPNDPVDYAIYEMARGGAHDFFGTLPKYDPAFVKALDELFEDD